MANRQRAAVFDGDFAVEGRCNIGGAVHIERLIDFDKTLDRQICRDFEVAVDVQLRIEDARAVRACDGERGVLIGGEAARVFRIGADRELVPREVKRVSAARQCGDVVRSGGGHIAEEFNRSACLRCCLDGGGEVSIVGIAHLRFQCEAAFGALAVRAGRLVRAALAAVLADDGFYAVCIHRQAEVMRSADLDGDGVLNHGQIGEVNLCVVRRLYDIAAVRDEGCEREVNLLALIDIVVTCFEREEVAAPLKDAAHNPHRRILAVAVDAADVGAVHDGDAAARIHSV